MVTVTLNLPSKYDVEDFLAALEIVRKRTGSETLGLAAMRSAQTLQAALEHVETNPDTAMSHVVEPAGQVGMVVHEIT